MKVYMKSCFSWSEVLNWSSKLNPNLSEVLLTYSFLSEYLNNPLSHGDWLKLSFADKT